MPTRLVIAAGAAAILLNASSAALASVTYSYDNQGRVVTAQYSNGTKIAYTYDNAGNITSRQVTCGGSGC